MSTGSVKQLKPNAANLTEDELALRFAEQQKDELRYVDAWSRWMVWTDGVVWTQERTRLAFHRARMLCRDFGGNTRTTAKNVAAVVTLACTDRRLAATTDQWDADPWALNTPGGIVDLKTGERTPNRPEAYMTKRAAVSPDPDCPVPVWTRFLETVTSGDRDLIAFLKRMAGYGLTGDTREHALFFLYGTGANGKSTFINAIMGCAGDYATSTPIDTFTASNNERHPTELADLRGARLVTATETEEGRRWAESRIKSLTGGDPIKARFMRQDFFEYVPQFKLVISGNHKPGLRSVDEAIRRRFNLVPFTVTIPKHERDTEFPETLKAEYPGILHWMIEGAREWLEHGLSPPEAVTSATAAYLEAEDALAAWIEDCCKRDPNAFETTEALFRNWKRWTERTGEHTGKQREFGDRLELRGCFRSRQRTDIGGNPKRGFYGLRLLAREDEDGSYWNH